VGGGGGVLGGGGGFDGGYLRKRQIFSEVKGYQVSSQGE